MRALSIRQPYVEQILRGIKTIEYRSRATGLVGERFYLYAARTPGPAEGFAGLGARPGELPTGLILGTAVITACIATPRPPRPGAQGYEWHLGQVRRLKRPRRPTRHPQPVWFIPFPQPRQAQAHEGPHHHHHHPTPHSPRRAGAGGVAGARAGA